MTVFEEHAARDRHPDLVEATKMSDEHSQAHEDLQVLTDRLMASSQLHLSQATVKDLGEKVQSAARAHLIDMHVMDSSISQMTDPDEIEAACKVVSDSPVPLIAQMHEQDHVRIDHNLMMQFVEPRRVNTIVELCLDVLPWEDTLVAPDVIEMATWAPEDWAEAFARGFVTVASVFVPSA